MQKRSIFYIILTCIQLTSLAYSPVVLWHGMGDDCCNPESMGRITELLKEHISNDVFVHSVKVGNTINDDHKAGFFGKIAEQVDKACEQLSNIPELSGGFNAIGFSQGGLFLRAYVERCNKPPVHRLITFGSPHAGVSDIPNCMNPKDFTCRIMRSMVRGSVYSDYIQNRVIQAQYYRDPNNEQAYLNRNIFLPDINNENDRNETYKENLSALDKFVMIRFDQDVMIKPSFTAWFWREQENHDLLPLKNQKQYTEDWLGLKSLNDRGRLEFLVCPGQHMQIRDEYLVKQVIEPYLKDNDGINRLHLLHQKPFELRKA
ncbi:palmitoyl protein thioesterase [Mycotypha africana]|uniref:palmitoyl protein thioesterase n=1 Tax=Mycotypha africana TaxID=64632 RepID=UPI0023001477|nr:palmitoyl protein thioesterase [Mycotypha africana]KAI8973197.1 palmitoyl protein thioesterase [Mycotypha africana]